MSKSENPPLEPVPVKCCKARNGVPHCEHFKFKPKPFPHLTEFVQHITWNSARKQVTVQINETPLFEVYQWLTYVEDKSHEMEKSPFMDIDTNSATLHFFDACDVPIAEVRLKNLSLIDHSTNLWKAAFSLESRQLSHSIVLGYQYAEFMTKVKEPVVENDDVAMDQEWQTEVI